MYSKIEYLTSDSIYINEVNQFLYDWFDEKEYIISKTSGSTGKPKELKLKKVYLRASARMTGNYFQFKETDNLLLSLPIFGIGGKMIIIRAIEFNCNLIVVSPQYNPLKDLKNREIKIISLVPYQVNKIIEEDKDAFSNVQNVLIGGAPVGIKLINKLKFLNTAFFETFGMTETYSHIALKNLKENAYFQILNNIKINTQNDCLQINAPHIGIQNLLTNDLINKIDESHFEWIGRKDFIINSGGVKLQPELIENKLEEIITTSYFISKEKDDNFGEIVVLIIEGLTIEEQTIRKILLNKLLSYEMPKKIYFLKEFEYTNTHKINRLETLKRLKNID
jgi:O-succinylbenzoic acid--CoA ligase